ncbi:hypothetical protein SCAB_48572 [Streptomyces scabiei 87.22]|uniref:Uncharacterized protein n=1 Tax=Streptomyces scabiei (strain 87.22) TaxID=680198 RepID=C9ZFC3_STRSW|nr:hypothetical protein SCAB_48572 [Streptomyces scabiei 87.22]
MRILERFFRISGNGRRQHLLWRRPQCGRNGDPFIHANRALPALHLRDLSLMEAEAIFDHPSSNVLLRDPESLAKPSHLTANDLLGIGGGRPMRVENLHEVER